MGIRRLATLDAFSDRGCADPLRGWARHRQLLAERGCVFAYGTGLRTCRESKRRKGGRCNTTNPRDRLQTLSGLESFHDALPLRALGGPNRSVRHGRKMAIMKAG